MARATASVSVLVNEITYNALTLVQDPYGNYVVLNRFSDAVILHPRRRALYAQDAHQGAPQPHTSRKAPLRVVRHNHCIQTGLNYAEGGRHALLVEGICPVFPLIRNTPYSKCIQHKLQHEQMDHYGSVGVYPVAAQQNLVNTAALRTHGLGRAPNPCAASMHAYGQQHPQAHLARGVDAYVLQGYSSHNLTAAGQYGAGYKGMGVAVYPQAVSLSGGLGDYQCGASYGYGM
ncbi:unnamed protein product [Peniophora sp. CBMAI 1063]|nr:unnamed protein product [Peniophora sp. CBMAI 1063]